MPKVVHASQAKVLTDVANIGKSIAQDLRGPGVNTLANVAAMDPIEMYDLPRTPKGYRHNPCVLDNFWAAKELMNGGPALPWWHFTEERRKLMLKTFAGR